MVMPTPLNIHLLTVDPRIRRYWFVIVPAVLVVELLTALLLSRCWSSAIDLDDHQNRLMVQLDDPMKARGRSRPFIVARWLLYATALVSGGALIGVWASSNWAAVIGFYVTLTAGVLFERFYAFAPLTDKRRYRIVD